MSLRAPMEPCCLSWLGHLQGFAAFIGWFGTNHIHGVSAAQEPPRGIVPVALGVLSLLHKRLGAVFFGTSHVKGNLE